MAQIIPFKGLRYNKEKIGDLAKVMTTPYDIISPDEQEQYYNMNDYNIIRLELGKEEPGDNEYDNKYARAASYLNSWIEEQVLIRESKPSLYIYQQRFTLSDGTVYTRTGFIGLVGWKSFQVLYCPMKIHCPNRKLTGCSLCVPAAQISVRYLAFMMILKKRCPGCLINTYLQMRLIFRLRLLMGLSRGSGWFPNRI